MLDIEHTLAAQGPAPRIAAPVVPVFAGIDALLDSVVPAALEDAHC